MIHIYTDGSAVAVGKNRGLGGIGIVFTINGEIKRIISKGYINTKTGRTELRAALTALKILKKDQQAIIHSDSQYVVKTIEEKWYKKWRRQEYKLCKNPDLIEELANEYEKFPRGNIRFTWVKGHSNNKWNELADQLADYKRHNIREKDLSDEQFNR